MRWECWIIAMIVFLTFHVYNYLLLFGKIWGFVKCFGMVCFYAYHKHFCMLGEQYYCYCAEELSRAIASILWEMIIWFLFEEELDVSIKFRPMHRYANTYWPTWRCCQCIVSTDIIYGTMNVKNGYPSVWMLLTDVWWCNQSAKKSCYITN